MLQYLLFFQCAILLASFEGIECSPRNYNISMFGAVDNYNKVDVKGDTNTGQFVFTKSYNVHLVLPFSDIVPGSLSVDGNDKQVVSFSVKGKDYTTYRIKFNSKDDAESYAKNEIQPKSSNLLWGRIRTEWAPAAIACDDLFFVNDVGFKVIDKKHLDNVAARIRQVNTLFKRSEIDNMIGASSPYKVYLRNKSRIEDYFVQFSNEDDFKGFKALFPNATYNGPETIDYYRIE